MTSAAVSAVQSSKGKHSSSPTPSSSVKSLERLLCCRFLRLHSLPIHHLSSGEPHRIQWGCDISSFTRLQIRHAQAVKLAFSPRRIKRNIRRRSMPASTITFPPAIRCSSATRITPSPRMFQGSSPLLHLRGQARRYSRAVQSSTLTVPPPVTLRASVLITSISSLRTSCSNCAPVIRVSRLTRSRSTTEQISTIRSV